MQMVLYKLAFLTVIFDVIVECQVTCMMKMESRRIETRSNLEKVITNVHNASLIVHSHSGYHKLFSILKVSLNLHIYPSAGI